MSDASAYLPAGDLAEAIRRKEISSRELLNLYLQRIERVNPNINAVVTLDTERAIETAARADQQTAAGSDLGPLHGLPVTIKDAIETAGIRSTGGSRELAAHVPVVDAPAVARLKQAGAIVVGKTNVPRWSGDIQTYNDLFGTTNNPWDTSKTTGGSSGGAAAAVATALTSFELGTDIGGSIRIPAGYCGVFGHKPSYGLVSQRGYLDRVGGGSTDPDINVFGPIARSASDLDLLLGVLAGPNEAEAKAWSLSLPPPRHTDLADYRIGTWLDDPFCAVESECVALLEQASTQLAQAGARVSSARPPIDIAAAFALFNNLLLPAISLSIDDEAKADLISGSHRKWLQLQNQRARLRTVWAEWFRDYDALLCPIMPMPPFPHDHSGTITDRRVVINGKTRSQVGTFVWVGMVGVPYLPSTVVPVGRTGSGLPVGVQVVGPYLEDRTGIFLASRMSELLGGYEAPPLKVSGSPLSGLPPSSTS
jgi:amidase